MKLLPTVTAAGLALLSFSAQVQADPAAAKVEVAAKSTNDLAFEVVGLVKDFFAAAGSATDVETANAAVVKINKVTERLVALEEPLKVSAKPTDAEIKAFAKRMVGFEKEMKELMGAMMMNMQGGGQEVAAIMQPAMQNMEKASATMELLETLYPKDKMEAYLKEFEAAEEGK